MKKVFQTVVGDGNNGVRGNCMQAAIASLLELELSEVPNFISFDTGNGESNTKMWEFLMNRGYSPSAFGTYDMPIDRYRDVCRMDDGVNGFFYASVKSMTFKESSHAVIIDSNLSIVHDPNPNGRCLGMELDSSNLNYILVLSDYWYVRENEETIRICREKNT